MTFIASLSTSPTLAAGFPAYPDFDENVYFILIGFGFVLLVLALLAGATSLMGSGLTRSAKSSQGKQPAAVATVPQSAPAEAAPFVEHSVPEHVPALIAAAVHTMLQGRRHRIKRVAVASGRWAQEGRRDIFSSHKVR